MKNAVWYSFMVVVLLSFSSCFINRTPVNGGPTGERGEGLVKYSKAKQMYVLWGFMALKHPETKTPLDCGYTVKTSFNAADCIASVLTLGIFSMRTVKVEVLRNGPCDPKIIRQEHRIDKEERNEGK